MNGSLTAKKKWRRSQHMMSMHGEKLGASCSDGEVQSCTRDSGRAGWCEVKHCSLLHGNILRAWPGKEQETKRTLNKYILWALQMPLPADWKQSIHLGTPFSHSSCLFDLTVQSLSAYLQNICHLCSYFELLIFTCKHLVNHAEITTHILKQLQKNWPSPCQIMGWHKPGGHRASHSTAEHSRVCPGCTALGVALLSARGSLWAHLLGMPGLRGSERNP